MLFGARAADTHKINIGVIFKINEYNRGVLKLNMHSFLLNHISPIIALVGKDPDAL